MNQLSHSLEGQIPLFQHLTYFVATNLRFKNPTPKEKWPEVFETHQQPNIWMQQQRQFEAIKGFSSKTGIQPANARPLLVASLMESPTLDIDSKLSWKSLVSSTQEVGKTMRPMGWSSILSPAVYKHGHIDHTYWVKSVISPF